MAFATTDPRRALAPIEATEPTKLVAAKAYHFKDMPPDSQNKQKNWYACGHSFIITYTEAEAGARLCREAEVDEHLVILYDDCEVVITAGKERRTIAGRRLIFLPPGNSIVEVVRGGRIIQASTRRSAPDLFAKCNEDPAAVDDPNVPAFEPAAPPFDGYKIRDYDLTADPVPGAFAAVWRCSSFLVLRGFWTNAQRDITRMSPHSHANFQQSNIFLEGEFRANLRWPWIADKREWRADEQLDFKAPSVLITPAQTIHTIEHRSQILNHCIDLYAPPRPDFVAMGWALNDNEYPRS